MFCGKTEQKEIAGLFTQVHVAELSNIFEEKSLSYLSKITRS